MQKSTTFMCCLLSMTLVAQRQKHEYKSSVRNCSYETTEGRLDGSYRSYYPDGKKKAEGTFENNYRIGNWTIWDEAGKVIAQRVYSSPFSFEQIAPKWSSAKQVIPYSPPYNKDGYIDYFKLEAADLVWSKRIWRYIPVTNNSVLFDYNRLFNLLSNNIRNKNIKAYKSSSDEMKEIELNETDSAVYTVVGYKIKEDTFLERSRAVSETRIICICPVAINRATKETVDLYWVYFPNIRKYLAQEKVTYPSLPVKIKNMDDLFFYRFFTSEIYKETNVFNRSIADYKKGEDIKKEAEKIEMDVIEDEQENWQAKG